MGRLNKAIISCLLVLTYTIGFTHNLVPHCAVGVVHIDQSSDSEHHHKHHKHSEVDPNEHDHIVHKGHFDKNYIDLVFCLLEDVEQNAEHCGQEHCFVISSEVLSLKNLPSKSFAYILHKVFHAVTVIESPNSYNGETFCNYNSPPLENSPHRGPPYTVFS